MPITLKNEMSERSFRCNQPKTTSNTIPNRAIPILPLHLQQTVYQQQQCGQWISGSPVLMSRVSPFINHPRPQISSPCPPHRPRQDSTSDIIPIEWISSPLMEGFPGCYNTNSIESKEELSNSLPYLDATWSPSTHSTSSGSTNDTSNSPSCIVSTGIAMITHTLGSTRDAPFHHTHDNTVQNSCQSPSLTHPTSPPLEDWDLLKPRSFSFDLGGSPAHLASMAPLFFPMEPEISHTEQPSSTCTTANNNSQHQASPSRSFTGGLYMQEDVTYTPTTSNDSTWNIGNHPPLLTYTCDSTTQCTTRTTMPIHLSGRGVNEISSTGGVYATHSSPQQLHPSFVSTRFIPIVSHTRNHSTNNETMALTPSIKLITPLNDCYWKNGRKNLQCFPTCPEHNDFYSMKMSNAKHANVGVCRGAVYCHVTLFAAPGGHSIGRNSDLTIPMTMGRDATLLQQQRMRYECGVGATGTGGSSQEVFILGQFERVPQCPTDENTNMSSDLTQSLPPPPHFSTSVAFEAFRYSCFQAVEMEERRVYMPTHVSTDHATQMVQSTWFFLPDVWKVQPMLKKKRKATRSMPAQTYPFCFRVFIYVRDDALGSNGIVIPVSPTSSYRCIATATSSLFELYSTRTVDRVKRKHWTGGSRK